jgi:hypothetical protein
MSRISSKSAEASYIEQLDIVSNEDQGRKVSVLGGVVELQYYESILDDGIRATVKFADAGNTIDNKTARDGLPIDGQETVNLKFRDNNEQTLKLTLYVKKVTPLSDRTTKSLIHLDLSSREIFMNDKVRLNTRFDGKISEHIREIFTNQNYLGITKDIEIEETSNNFNFCGNNMKPYYAMNWLSKKAVSAENQTLGVSAGYFFFETSEGYKFKSIDGLLSQEKKKSIIYNETPDTRGQNIPAGYDIKALDYTFDNKVNVEDKLKMGAYSTRTILFDPFNCFYQVINPVARDTEGSLKLGGKRLPTPNPEFNKSGRNKEFSRTQYMLIDKGTIPTGRTQQQVEKSKEQNFDPERILNQSSMRYNQLFASKCTITIAGDFSLHAGDVVFFDAPDAQTDTKNDDVNKETGGLYIIADLCHYITPKETYTKLNLVRDSFGRKGNHTSNSALR